MNKLLLGAALCTLSTSVSAQEAATFDGAHIDVLAGYDRLNLSIDYTDFEYEVSSDDIFYGAAAGYDWQSANFLFGVEGEIASSGHGEEVQGSEFVDGSDVEGTVSLSDGLNWYVGGRVGLVEGSNLFYGKAGFARAVADFDVDGTIDDEPVSDSADLNFDGFRIGAGYERSFGGFLGKIEYRYTSYQDSEVSYDGVSVDLEDELGEFDLDRHQIVVGLGYRF